jgi:hypothetical protein
MWSYIALREINESITELVERWREAGRPIPQFDIEFRPFFLFAGHLEDDEIVDRDVSPSPVICLTLDVNHTLTQAFP